MDRSRTSRGWFMREFLCLKIWAVNSPFFDVHATVEQSVTVGTHLFFLLVLGRPRFEVT